MELTKTDQNHFYIVTKSINAALEYSNSKADVVMYSSLVQEDKVTVDGPVIFDSPGEFEVKNCMIDAVSLAPNNTAYGILSEGIRVAYIADAKVILTDLQLEAFASIDILLVPITGEKAAVTTKIIGQIEPKVVIPHSYNAEELKVLTDELGQEQEKTSKFKIQKKELAESEQLRLVVLE